MEKIKAHDLKFNGQKPAEPFIFNEDDAELLEYAVRQAFVGRLTRDIKAVWLAFDNPQDTTAKTFLFATVTVVLIDPDKRKPDTVLGWINKSVETIWPETPPPVKVELRKQGLPGGDGFPHWKTGSSIHYPTYQTADMF